MVIFIYMLVLTFYCAMQFYLETAYSIRDKLGRCKGGYITNRMIY